MLDLKLYFITTRIFKRRKVVLIFIITSKKDSFFPNMKAPHHEECKYKMHKLEYPQNTFQMKQGIWKRETTVSQLSLQVLLSEQLVTCLVTLAILV